MTISGGNGATEFAENRVASNWVHSVIECLATEGQVSKNIECLHSLSTPSGNCLVGSRQAREVDFWVETNFSLTKWIMVENFALISVIPGLIELSFA